MQTIQYELKDGIATLTFDEPGSPVNTMCEQWQADLTEATAQVVQGQGRDQGHRAGLGQEHLLRRRRPQGTMRLQPRTRRACSAEIEQTKKNFRTLETLGKPVVSCINGAALGGGWEVALVGHYRMAVDDPKIQLGLPEITLGLIPGASGITKMTRLLGLMGAQPYILESKLFNPREALELGLVHELVPTPAELRAAALAWIAANTPGATTPGTTRTTRCPAARPPTPRLPAC
jgi:3-hydroxyacyl-CoA dehydrogenase/enoyl-CoA hydratase/3-hydroxybutyryl-CoA epimerase